MGKTPLTELVLFRSLLVYFLQAGCTIIGLKILVCQSKASRHQAVSNIDSCVTLFITASRRDRERRRRKKKPGRRHLARIGPEGTLKLLLTRRLMMAKPRRVGFIPRTRPGTDEEVDASEHCGSLSLSQLKPS